MPLLPPPVVRCFAKLQDFKRDPNAVQNPNPPIYMFLFLFTKSSYQMTITT